MCGFGAVNNGSNIKRAEYAQSSGGRTIQFPKYIVAGSRLAEIEYPATVLGCIGQTKVFVIG